MIKINPLKNGDLISLVAPAGTFDRERFNKGKVLIESFGYRVCYDEDIFRKKRYVEDEDRKRAETVNRAFADKSVKGIIAVRGGYGSGRTLQYIDFDMIKANPKVFCGSSDITFLHIAIQKLCGFTTYYGPMPAGNSKVKKYGDEFKLFFDITSGIMKNITVSIPDIEIIRSAKNRGKITGGCLSIINATIGTPWEINTRGKILFIEDIGEPPYKVDRMLYHLKMAGKFTDLRGLIVGHMVDEKGEINKEWSAVYKEMIFEVTRGTGYPIIYGFPAGHGAGSMTIPVNGKVSIDGEGGFVKITDFGVSND